VTDKFQVVRLTMQVDYVFPVTEGGLTLNGWTMKELVKSFFKKFNINSYHASRDSHQLGGSKKILRIDILEDKL